MPPKYEEPKRKRTGSDRARESDAFNEARALWTDSYIDPIMGSLLRKTGGSRARSKAEQEHNLRLAGSLGEGGGDWADMMRRFQEGHAGEAKNFGTNLSQMAPLIFAQLLKTDAAKDLMDPQKMTDLAYRPGAAAIASGTEQGLRGARGSLAMSGLSSSGAYPMLEAQMRMQSAGMQGNLYTNLMQQQMQNSWSMQRDVAGMGMGMAPQGNIGGGGGGGGNAWIGPLAQAAGSFAGYYLNRPQTQAPAAAPTGGSV